MGRVEEEKKRGRKRGRRIVRMERGETLRQKEEEERGREGSIKTVSTLSYKLKRRRRMEVYIR